MLSFLKDEASIFQIADRIIFSLSAGEGFSQNELNLDDYVNLLKQERKNFLPKLYINNSTLVKNFKDSEIKDISLETLHLLFIKERSFLPNLYRSGFHLDYWIKRYQINKLDLALAIAATSLLVIYPISSTFLNNSYADEYKNETISIFKKINPNIKRVVNPRRQIDEILNSYNLEQASNLSISGLDSIKRLDIPEITKLYMDINKSEAQLTLSGLGSNQYQFLINLLPQANLNLITEDVKTSNGKVSGLITIGLSD
jgi:type II secretory pathway component PulL